MPVLIGLSDTHRKSLVNMKGINNMEQVVTSSVMPPKITYQPMGDGKAFVMLRKNIKKVTETMYGENGEQTTEMYQYNEKQFYTKLSEEEVNKQFDSLYLTADVPEPSITEQINNISDVLNDVLDRMDELESKGE